MRPEATKPKFQIFWTTHNFNLTQEESGVLRCLCFFLLFFSKGLVACFWKGQSGSDLDSAAQSSTQHIPNLTVFHNEGILLIYLNPIPDLRMVAGWYLQQYSFASDSFLHSHMLFEAFTHLPMDRTWPCCPELGVNRENTKLWGITRNLYPFWTLFNMRRADQWSQSMTCESVKTSLDASTCCMLADLGILEAFVNMLPP